MTYEKSIILSMIILVGSLLAYILPKILRLFKNSIMTLYIGTFAAIVIIFMPGYKDCGILETIFSTFYKAIGIFLFDFDFSEVLESIEKTNNISAFRTYLSFLILFCPLMTVGAFLEFIAEFIDELKFYLRMVNKTTYVFSELNDRTYEYAKSIITNHKKIFKESYNIVFTGVVKDDSEYEYEMRKKAKKINAMCLKRNIKNVKIGDHIGKRRRMFFYFWSQNEEENLEEAMYVADKLEKVKATVTLNVYSTTEEAEIVVDSLNRKYINKNNILIYKKNEYSALIQDLLYKRPLFVGSKNNKISVLIIGSGFVGEEALKYSVMCGQLLDFELEINVISKNASELKNKMYITMPEIIGKKDLYNINFYDVDVEDRRFKEIVKEHDNINYVIVSLGDDSLNVETAVTMRTLCIQSHIEHCNTARHEKMAVPIINVFIEDSMRINRIENLENISGEQYNLYTFGVVTKQGNTTLVDPKYERMAKNIHCIYWKEEDFFHTSEICTKSFKYEYNRKSSQASAMHTIYKVYYCLKDKYDSEYFINNGPTDFYKSKKHLIDEYNEIIKNDEQKEMLLKLGITEHLRWCAYNRINGYICASDEMLENYFYVFDENNANEQNGIVCNQIAKMHPCLVEWTLHGEKKYDNGENDALEHVAKVVNDLIKKHNLNIDKKDFKESDFMIVKEISNIYAQDQIGIRRNRRV